MKKHHLLTAACLALTFASCSEKLSYDPVDYVVTTMGTSADGGIVPNVAVPFGMVQLAPDTFEYGTGYRYEHKSLMGFSHMHKSGSGGGADYLDILFTPVTGEAWTAPGTLPDKFSTAFSHDDEITRPGYYSVRLPEYGIEAELAATKRCGMHRYSFPQDADNKLLIDLKHGNPGNCTIIAEDNFDTVKLAYMEKVDEYAVRGFRISNGWCPEMHVYFYARFNKPIKDFKLYEDCKALSEGTSLEGRDVRALLTFGGDPAEPLEIGVGISPVDMDGAKKNLDAEIGGASFDKISRRAHDEWSKELSTIQVNDPDSPEGRTLYSCYYFSLLYPMLYGDVDGRFRSGDKQVHEADFDFYAGVLGLWDIYRAHLPLITVVHPEVTQDLMNTFLQFYKDTGMLPLWVLSGQETNCMEGYHSAPAVADAYAKGIRGFDAEAMLEALNVSACADTFGYFCRAYRGAKNYLDLHYVPCDKEISSASKTLEYAYDDWCISQFAGMLGNEGLAATYRERSKWYANVFDPAAGLMHGRKSDGSWREPFDPFYSNHLREDDDFMEGTAWHWTFHVPHDPHGLMELMGGKDVFASKLDSLFFVLGPDIHGPNPSHDMTGMIGHYAQGNEPGHHIIYMYNFAGQPWKTQQIVTRVMHELYDTTPKGICGNDDTGQMSAWYVWNSFGLYPYTHGDGIYMIGTPQHEHMTLKHSSGTLTVDAPGAGRECCYIKSVTLNGKPYGYSWFKHGDIFNGDAAIRFEMTSDASEAAALEAY